MPYSPPLPVVLFLLVGARRDSSMDVAERLRSELHGSCSALDSARLTFRLVDSSDTWSAMDGGRALYRRDLDISGIAEQRYNIVDLDLSVDSRLLLYFTVGQLGLDL